MSVTKYQVFLAVAACGGFTRAAEELHFTQSGVSHTIAALENELALAGAEYAIYDKITPNPTKSEVMAGAALAREHGCDFVIGFGGGSSIDAGKAIAVMATNPGDYWDYISGGTGKAKLLNPTALTVSEGKITATIVWSSSNYDYMIVNGDQYLPITTEGGSTFQIPVESLGVEIPVTADTVAMGTPHEIAYTILLQADTVSPEA